MSRKGVASLEPFLTMRMRPVFSTTNSREVSPGGDVTYRGWSNVPTDSQRDRGRVARPGSTQDGRPASGRTPAAGIGVDAAVVGLGPWKTTSAPRPTSTAAPTMMATKLRMVGSFRASPYS